MLDPTFDTSTEEASLTGLAFRSYSEGAVSSSPVFNSLRERANRSDEGLTFTHAYFSPSAHLRKLSPTLIGHPPGHSEHPLSQDTGRQPDSTRLPATLTFALPSSTSPALLFRAVGGLSALNDRLDDGARHIIGTDISTRYPSHDECNTRWHYTYSAADFGL
ncbi:hypothetical protein C8Q76DRAFT_791273 [Earliella scabrosa]|nr:hypothetical protein C8Q76DRAFT_791273 [Earliella scabrosa]